jgi:hypothetical protein
LPFKYAHAIDGVDSFDLRLIFQGHFLDVSMISSGLGSEITERHGSVSNQHHLHLPVEAKIN